MQQTLLRRAQQPLLRQAQQALPNWPNIYKFATSKSFQWTILEDTKEIFNNVLIIQFIKIFIDYMHRIDI